MCVRVFVYLYPAYTDAVSPEQDRAHALDKGEAIKLLKGGIEMSDRVVTVAPSYKDEIMVCAWSVRLGGCCVAHQRPAAQIAVANIRVRHLCY